MTSAAFQTKIRGETLDDIQRFWTESFRDVLN